MTKTVTQSEHYPDEKGQNDPMAGRRPWIRLDSAERSGEADDQDGIGVRIIGHNLRMVISPPLIEVGGIPLTNVTFDEDGKVIRGTLSKEPEHDRVVVDYGFARDETTIS